MEAGSSSGTIVLVHGGFVDGSGWQGVYDHLKKDGYSVNVVQNPTVSLADDAAVTKGARRSERTGPLVGHSYGGAVVITEAGTHPKVAALVHIAASRRTPASRSTPDFRSAARRTRAADSAAAGRVPVSRPRSSTTPSRVMSAEQAAFMADSQVPGLMPWAARSRSCLAQAKLVPRHDRRPDDPSTGPCAMSERRPLLRSRAAIRFTSHSLQPWPTSSRRPLSSSPATTRGLARCGRTARHQPPSRTQRITHICAT